MNESIDLAFEERLKIYERDESMKDLIAGLKEIPGSYVGFVAAVVAYTSRSSEGQKFVKNYMDSVEQLTTSDILRFVSQRPDFYDCVVGGEIAKKKAVSKK